MQLITLIRVLLIGLLCLKRACSLDVSWIPSDPDGPLPLSKSYRDSLRKLCDLISTKQINSLPPELIEKKPVLQKLCIRLKADDENVLSTQSLIKFSPFKTIVGILGIGGTYILWKNKTILKNWFLKMMGNSIKSSEKVEYTSAIFIKSINIIFIFSIRIL